LSSARRPCSTAGDQLGPGDADSERQVATQLDDRPGCLRLGRNPLGADHLGQQLDCLVTGQDVQHHGVGRHQPAEQGPAGDEHGRARSVRQQRAHLRLLARAVEHDQHPPIGQLGAISRGPLVEAFGDGRPSHAELHEELGEHVARLHQLPVRASQVDVELAVRKGRPQLVGDPGHQRRLADAGLTGDGGHHHGGRLIAGKLQQVPDRPQGVISTGEVIDVGR
jgi:hypothetical protein